VEHLPAQTALKHITVREKKKTKFLEEKFIPTHFSCRKRKMICYYA